MSRVGRMPIPIPAGVQVQIENRTVTVKGPKGELCRTFSPLIGIVLDDGQLRVVRWGDTPIERALHGTTRAVLANMIHGVSQGFEKVLEVEGVGYRAEMSGKNLLLYMGYSHPIEVAPPPGVSFEVDAKTRQIKVLGYDKEVVGQVAAEIVKVRPPEPYHGKGIRYQGEKIRRKAGKAGKTGKTGKGGK